MVTHCVTIFLFSLVCLFLARKVAKKTGLLDKPNHRKRHQGQIPLVGGISIYAGICFTCLYINHYIPHVDLYLICAGILVVTGVLDDRFDISVLVRTIIQALVSVVMMVYSGQYINSLGYIFGPYEVILGPGGYLVTLFAVWAAINAFNMVDGIDGLLGGLSCVSLSAIGIFFILENHARLALLCFGMIASVLPYIFFNLGFFGQHYKVFMGDSGSTMIGFTIIWLLLYSTQGWGHPMNPVTGLWIIAIPLMDMIAIIYRRLRKGMSPFTPDRQHIHHLIMRAGFSERQAFIIITFTAAQLAFFGMAGERWLHLPESVMLLLWLGVLLVYGYVLKCPIRLIQFVKRSKRRFMRYRKILL
ncbi:UDP-N-acetylglucosamine--undecaprenyl-phosphate N-acetylglucosaminephosphotransferase [Candidatus Steffania adelgidicola]|uniref:UDP-N-acetylglucosamine--undecaprenyl-phosphate N-acetylglucosaminephosphotransferase n=1 Tax=Candidatus Steffania adelgidicola TaxID=1076626 RepID=UPI001D02D914|nr:UDP-N-acetylglucosamine--undecaprenyl-phosphate N-acetylglucosaminephosphotransferase [Candidatus Steffania adelgidicola]UDG79575.1 Undecaprenyl-phosphate alpha-N-acetylglucosaminyl 1-phosphate transferase [Candidatus Steffania adelgidicola]